MLCCIEYYMLGQGIGLKLLILCVIGIAYIRYNPICLRHYRPAFTGPSYRMPTYLIAVRLVGKEDESRYVSNHLAATAQFLQEYQCFCLGVYFQWIMISYGAIMAINLIMIVGYDYHLCYPFELTNDNFQLIISMSKTKGKQKKPENYEVLQKEYEAQRRQLLDATFTLRKMEERVNLLSSQNHRLQQQREEQFHALTEKIEELNIKNQTNEKRLITMRNDLTTAEVQNKKLTNTLALLEKNMSDERIEKTKEYEELKKNYAFEIAKYDNMLTDYKLYMSERDNRQREISDLVEQREIQIANRIRDVADKEREKVQATDKIRDEMGNKIRQMRQNLLSLKKEELETTTRLTMLQNHQLTSQLEYQSKQTEKIVFKNEELEASIVQLRQQLQIHKQVEEQLAKRSHFSKGIIKKLHARVTQLQEELKKEQEARSHSQISEAPTKGQKQEKSMISAIEKQLQKSEKKYAELYTRFEALQREKDQMHGKLQTQISSKNKILTILMRASQNLQVDKENGDLKLSLSELKAKEIKQWSFEETRAVLQIMLAACRPVLTKQQLSNQIYNRVVIFEGDKNAHALLPKLSTQRQKLAKCSSENRLACGYEDMSKLAKQELSKQKYSVNIASKMVIGKVRDWGRPLTKSRGNLQRKYKLSSTFRN